MEIVHLISLEETRCWPISLFFFWDFCKKNIVRTRLDKFTIKAKLTTSMICCSVRPNVTLNGSDSFATGRSSVLYVAKRLLRSRFS